MSFYVSERTESKRAEIDGKPLRKRGRPALDAPDHRADRREDIIEAASYLFLHKGYTETTLRRVATEARVNVALIHYYFTNKQGLYLEVLTSALSEMLTSLKRYQKVPPTPYHLIRTLTEPLIENAGLGRTLLLPQDPPDALEMVSKVKRRLRQLLLSTLQTMHCKELLPKELDTDLLASTVLDLCWGPIRDLLEKKPDSFVELSPSVKPQIEQNTKVLEIAFARHALT